MTRVNADIKPLQLVDQHLLAERIIKKKYQCSYEL